MFYPPDPGSMTISTIGGNAEEMHRVEAAFAEILEEAIRLGGTITGEHGIGVASYVTGLCWAVAGLFCA